MKQITFRRGSLSLSLLGVLLVVLTALGAGAARPGKGRAPASVVSGRVEFEDVTADENGLHIPGPGDPEILFPAVGVTVQVVDAVNKRVVAETTTAFNGSYGVFVAGGLLNQRGLMYVRALAETRVAKVLHRRTHSLYSIRSPVVRVRGAQTSVPTLSARDRGRASGPFHILATLDRGADVVTPPGTIGFTPTCTVFWDTVTATGTRADTPNRWLYLAGDRRRDSDEFDESVILHEYGHIAAAALSNADSPGGDHHLGERVDPRLAWSEGWATYLAQSVLGSPIYVDTTGMDGSVVTQYSLDPVRMGAETGYHSEFTVSSLLWHALSPGLTPHLGASQAQIQLAFRGLAGERQVYLVDFCARLQSPLIATLEDYQAFLREFDLHYFQEYPHVSDPFPAQLRCRVPESGAVDSITDRRHNLAGSTAFFEFEQLNNSPEAVRIDLSRIAAPNPPESRLELYLYNSLGLMVGRSVLPGGGASEGSVELPLARGKYAVEVRSYQVGNDGVLRFNRAGYRLTRIHPSRDAQIVDLGTLEPDPNDPDADPPHYLGSSVGLALSNTNPPLVTGYSTTSEDNFFRAFHWDSTTGPVDAGAGRDSTGTGINQDGAICGSLALPNSPLYRAFFLPEGGAPQLLGLPDAGLPDQHTSVANGMNAIGQVVGSSRIALRNARTNQLFATILGFVSGPGGSGASALGTLIAQSNADNPLDYEGTSVANAISPGGVVVGDASAPGNWRRAVRWDGGPEPEDLGTLIPDASDPSGFRGDSSAHAINANGVIVGSTTHPLLGRVACVWEGGQATALSARPGTGVGQYTVARGINQSNVIVGEAGVLPSLPSPLAVLWKKVGGGWVEEELTRKVCPDERWKLSSAVGINDYGWVVGYGEKGASGVLRGYALRLIPPGPPRRTRSAARRGGR